MDTAASCNSKQDIPSCHEDTKGVLKQNGSKGKNHLIQLMMSSVKITFVSARRISQDIEVRGENGEQKLGTVGE